jgi:hypothetical protein
LSVPVAASAAATGRSMSHACCYTLLCKFFFSSLEFSARVRLEL